MAAASVAACQSKRDGGKLGSSVRETQALDGMQWPTPDPFLFCVHHDDAYPAGNAAMGPQASLAGYPGDVPIRDFDHGLHTIERRLGAAP